MDADDIMRSTLASVRSAVRTLPSRAIADIHGSVDPDDALAHSRLAGIALDAAHNGLEAAVGFARDCGYSSTVIGAVLGISRQGAEQQFHDR